MNHTLVGKNLAYGAASSGSAATPDALVAGAIGGFGFDRTDGTFKLVTPATLGNFNDITFYLGLGGGKVFQSVKHDLKGNCAAVKLEYRAATNTTVVLAGFVAPYVDAYTPYARPVGFISIGEDVPNFLNYGNVYRADVGNLPTTATAEQVRDAVFNQLKAKFDQSGEATVTAGGSGAGVNITIEFLNPEKKYYVARDGYLQGLTATWTYGDVGVGTKFDVPRREELDRIYRGNLYTAEAPVYGIYNVPAQYTAGTNYDALYLESVNITDDKTGQRAWTTTRVFTFLYVPDGSGASTALSTFATAIAARGQGIGPQGPQGAPGA